MSKNNRQPRYAKRLVAAIQQALDRGELKPGQLYVNNVYHDDWCAIYTGAGPCNCNPRIETAVEVTKEQWVDAMMQTICNPGQTAVPPSAN